MVEALAFLLQEYVPVRSTTFLRSPELLIRLVVKTQVTNVLEVGCEFFWEGFINRDLHFLVFDELILLVPVTAFRPCYSRDPGQNES